MSIFAVVSTSGNVGKTMIAREVIYESLPNEESKIILEVETINTSTSDLGYPGIQVKKVSGEDPMDIYREMMYATNTIVDVGASNFSHFIKGLEKNPEMKEDIDVFVVPVSASSGKQISDAISTLRILKENGVQDKVVIVFNHIEDSPAEDIGANFFEAIEAMGYTYDDSATIAKHGVVGLLEKEAKTSKDLSGDTTDYKALAKKFYEQRDKEKAERASSQHVAKIEAKNMRTEADRVYGVIMKKLLSKEPSGQDF